MNKSKIKRIIKIGGLTLILAYIGLVIFDVSKVKSTVYTGEVADNIDIYDDKEFYYMTHNDDGTTNEYGKSLE